MNTQKLITQYENICNKIVKEFCKKQEIEFDYWVVDEVGIIACFNSDIFIDFPDVLTDMRENQPKSHILNWYYDNLANSLEKKGTINYYSYINGLRVKELE